MRLENMCDLDGSILKSVCGIAISLNGCLYSGRIRVLEEGDSGPLPILLSPMVCTPPFPHFEPGQAAISSEIRRLSSYSIEWALHI